MNFEKKVVDLDESRQIFANSEAGRRLSQLGYAEDVEFCARFDTLNLAPVYRKGMGFVPI